MEMNEIVTMAAEMDLETLKELIQELSEVKKAKAEEAKATLKANKEALGAEADARGKAYYDTLSVGDVFSITNSKGDVVELRKIETKSGSGNSAAGELVIPVGKNPNRYPRFRQVNIPTEE